MNLIYCSTMYNLINAVNILKNKLKSEETDLLIRCATNFTSVIPLIEEMHLFRKIYQVPDQLEHVRTFRDKLSDKERQQIGKLQKKFFDYPELETNYQHLYLNVEDVYAKMLYYYLLEGSSHIDIHFYEDGLVSYIENYTARTFYDRLPHSYYGKKAFDKNIVECFLYEPDLYSGSPLTYPILQLNKLTEENISTNTVRTLFESVYAGRPPLQEPFVFFAEAFIRKFMTVEDISVLDFIASVVGKENILVKLHPAEPIDRFTRRGYKVEKATPFPWESQVLCNVTSRKAAISFNSTACISAKMVFDLDLFCIFMCKLPVIGAGAIGRIYPNWKQFLQKALALYKEDEIMFAPKSLDELKENLLFIGGMLHG